MRKPCGSIVGGMVFLVSLVGAPLAAQLSAAEVKTIQRETTLPVAYSSWVVTESFTGTLQEVGGFLATFLSDFTAQHLDAELGSFRPLSVVLLSQDPAAANAITLQVGLTVPGGFTVRPPLRTRQILLSRAVLHTHTGPYEDGGLVHAAMESALPAGRRLAWPVVLLLLNDPKGVSPAEIQSTMIVQEQTTKK